MGTEDDGHALELEKKLSMRACCADCRAHAAPAPPRRLLGRGSGLLAGRGLARWKSIVSPTAARKQHARPPRHRFVVVRLHVQQVDHLALARAPRTGRSRRHRLPRAGATTRTGPRRRRRRPSAGCEAGDSPWLSCSPSAAAVRCARGEVAEQAAEGFLAEQQAEGEEVHGAQQANSACRQGRVRRKNTGTPSSGEHAREQRDMRPRGTPGRARVAPGAALRVAQRGDQRHAEEQPSTAEVLQARQQRHEGVGHAGG